VADDVEAVKAEAIAFLHAALVRGSGVDDALRRAFYRNRILRPVVRWISSAAVWE
jgi:hypothetical protein